MCVVNHYHYHHYYLAKKKKKKKKKSHTCPVTCTLPYSIVCYCVYVCVCVLTNNNDLFDRKLSLLYFFRIVVYHENWLFAICQGQGFPFIWWWWTYITLYRIFSIIFFWCKRKNFFYMTTHTHTDRHYLSLKYKLPKYIYLSNDDEKHVP